MRTRPSNKHIHGKKDLPYNQKESSHRGNHHPTQFEQREKSKSNNGRNHVEIEKMIFNQIKLE